MKTWNEFYKTREEAEARVRALKDMGKDAEANALQQQINRDLRLKNQPKSDKEILRQRGGLI